MRLLIWSCPICRKKITSQYQEQLDWNVESHKKSCKEKQQRLKE